MSGPSVVWEVRYDDDEAYYPVARFTDHNAADRLMARLIEAHRAADHDDCFVAEYWTVAELIVDAIDPDTAPLPPRLFETEDGGHGDVNAYDLALMEHEARNA